MDQRERDYSSDYPPFREGESSGGKRMGTFGLVGLILIFLVVIGIIALIGVRNGLITRDEAVQARWSDIDTQLQRRADLIPNLVKTVQGYADHEEEVLRQVTESREKLLAATTITDKAEADSVMNQALGRLLAIMENYPDLKANENFIRLQDELAGTENRIGVARKNYNDSVREFNSAIRRFPGSLFASRLGFTKKDYFQATGPATSGEVPQVEF